MPDGMAEVRCCCTPQNLLGYAPLTSDLEFRELTDGTWAFSSEGVDDIDAVPGFVRANRPGGGRKTWKKTWKNKPKPK